MYTSMHALNKNLFSLCLVVMICRFVLAFCTLLFTWNLCDDMEDL